MSEQADWGAIPRAVVSQILWSDDLRLLDRLRCQGVCRTWKSLLRERPSAAEHSVLSTQLCINVCCSRTHRQHVVLLLDRKPAAIYVKAAPSVGVVVNQVALITFEDRLSDCCRWLTLQAPLLCEVKLSGGTNTWWLMRDIVRVLQIASPQTPPAIELTEAVGSEILNDCEGLLVNMLVRLRFVTLAPWQHLDKIAQMMHLTFLDLTGKPGRGHALN